MESALNKSSYLLIVNLNAFFVLTELPSKTLQHGNLWYLQHKSQRLWSFTLLLQYGNTPVKLAAEKENSEAVRLLIQKEADVTIADTVSDSCMLLQCFN